MDVLVELKDNKVLGVENRKVIKMEGLKVILKQNCIEFFDTINANDFDSMQHQEQ